MKAENMGERHGSVSCGLLPGSSLSAFDWGADKNLVVVSHLLLSFEDRDKIWKTSRCIAELEPLLPHVRIQKMVSVFVRCAHVLGHQLSYRP
jgi:hypothetical protein